jgi:hypothetical protein
MTRNRCVSAAVAAAVVAAAPAGAALADPVQPSLLQAIEGGRPILDLRPRYEQVDQNGLFREAEAFTLRTQLGWRTAAWRRLVAQVEMENVVDLDGQRYNSTLNGKTAYPVVGDPPTTELHVAELQWTPVRDLSATVGRQRINLDDQRFIGTVNWRQDEQTFDAARVDGALGRFSLTYIYLEHIDRPFAQAQDWSSDSHALNVRFAAAPALKLEGFGYAFDFRQSPANSTQTYGATASGQVQLAPVKLTYAATYARQQPYRNNPGRFGLNYWHGQLAGSAGPWSVKADYEVLGGDGVHGFATPLATLHAFQGWADVFLTTPAKGVRDASLSLDFKPALKLPALSHPELFIRYDVFKADTDGSSLGREWDAMATAQLAPHLTGLVELADYQGPARGPASRTKVWVGLEFRL